MGMALERALFLSSKKQAKTFETVPIGFYFHKKIYKLLVTRIADLGMCRLEIFSITYPDAKEGKGWGDACVAKEPHSTTEKDMSAMKAFLQAHQYRVDDGWEPVEEVSA